MVRLDREDRIACDDEIGPLFGPQEELAFRLESVVGPRLDREETIEGRDRVLPAVQLDARVGLRIEGARVPRFEGDDLRGFLDDLVPSSERPERLEPAFPRRERLRSQADCTVVGAHRIDAPAGLAQQFGAAGPRGRVSVSLTERLVVGSQRLVVLVRRPEDVAAEPPRVRVVRVQLDHAVEASDRPLRLSCGEIGERLPLQGFLGLRVDPQGAVERRLRLVEFVPPAVGFSRPYPELGIVGDEREDAGISFRIIGVEVHDLHVRADRLWPLLQRDVGVPFSFPEVLGLRIDAQSGVVVTERIGRALLGEEDVPLEAQCSKISSVASQGVRRRRLGGLDPTDPQEPRPDRRIGFLKILDPCPRLLCSEDLERLDERDRCAAARVHFERRETGLRQSVRLVERSSYAIEETLEEGHPYHPIPRGALNSGPRRTSGRHGKSMTYRYRQGPAPWTIAPIRQGPLRCDNRAKYARHEFGLTIVRRDGTMARKGVERPKPTKLRKETREWLTKQTIPNA